MEPLLLDIPDRIETPRLELRVPRTGDGAAIAAVVQASLPELQPWMPWAKPDYCQRDGEEWARRSAASFIERTTLSYTIWDRSDLFMGSVGAHHMEWTIPKAEIGYWLRTDRCGRGLMTEAVNAISNMLAGTLRITRIEIRADKLNSKSWRVAQRCGFVHEGTLRCDFRYPDGRLRDTRLYSRVS